MPCFRIVKRVLEEVYLTAEDAAAAKKQASTTPGNAYEEKIDEYYIVASNFCTEQRS